MNAVTQPAYEMSLDAALDRFLADRWPPAAWQRIRHVADLPWRFEQLARALPADSWRAYSDGARLGFAVGKFASAPRQRTGCADLAVSFYDTAGFPCAAGVWRAVGADQWILHAALA